MDSETVTQERCIGKAIGILAGAVFVERHAFLPL